MTPNCAPARGAADEDVSCYGGERHSNRARHPRLFTSGAPSLTRMSERKPGTGPTVAASMSVLPIWGHKGTCSKSFQTQASETADVSLTLETIVFCKYPTPRASLRNRTQEADGSIPFKLHESTAVFFDTRLRGDEIPVTVVMRTSGRCSSTRSERGYGHIRQALH